MPLSHKIVDALLEQRLAELNDEQLERLLERTRAPRIPDATEAPAVPNGTPEPEVDGRQRAATILADYVKGR